MQDRPVHFKTYVIVSIDLRVMSGEYRSMISRGLENTEGAIKNGQSRKTGNIGYTRQRKTKQKQNAIRSSKTKMFVIKSCFFSFYSNNVSK
jgi:hypothetical protein